MFLNCFDEMMLKIIFKNIKNYFNIFLTKKILWKTYCPINNIYIYIYISCNSKLLTLSPHSSADMHYNGNPTINKAKKRELEHIN